MSRYVKSYFGQFAYDGGIRSMVRNQIDHTLIYEALAFRHIPVSIINDNNIKNIKSLAMFKIKIVFGANLNNLPFFQKLLTAFWTAS